MRARAAMITSPQPSRCRCCASASAGCPAGPPAAREQRRRLGAGPRGSPHRRERAARGAAGGAERREAATGRAGPGRGAGGGSCCASPARLPGSAWSAAAARGGGARSERRGDRALVQQGQRASGCWHGDGPGLRPSPAPCSPLEAHLLALVDGIDALRPEALREPVLENLQRGAAHRPRGSLSARPAGRLPTPRRQRARTSFLARLIAARLTL
jgi:hypothetical protein